MPDLASHPDRPLPGIGSVLAGQVSYQLRLLARTPRALWFAIFAPAGLLALRLGHIGHVGGRQAASAAVIGLMASLAVFGLLNTAYLTHASGLVAARQDGVLRRWRLVPVPASGFFAGRIVATVVLADAGGALVILIGAAMTGVHVAAGAIPALLVVLTTGALAWAALGTAVTALVPTAEASYPVIGLTYLPVIFVSGVFGAFPGAPGWLTTLVRYLPAQPVIDAATGVLSYSGGGLAPVPGADLATLCAWGAGGLLLAVRFFRWDPQRPPRRSHQRTTRGLALR